MSKSPNRLLATIFGAVYLLLGIFEVNTLHNVAHLLVGAALLIAGLSGVRAAKTIDTVVGVVYLLLGIVGLFIVNTDLNILALNVPDHVLHFASAVILLGVGLGADRATRTAVA
jgi:hypothetical protein